jgi:hypothetical protein
MMVEQVETALAVTKQAVVVVALVQQVLLA